MPLLVDDDALLTAAPVSEYLQPNAGKAKFDGHRLSDQDSQYSCRTSLSKHVVASSAVPFATCVTVGDGPRTD